MYIYQITNKINGKIYIGQTNNIKKRWSNHRCGNNKDMVIARAIKKYGVENFSFEILLKGLTEEEADNKEIELIKEKNSKVPNGYNVADGGHRKSGVSHFGADNSNAKLTEEEAQFILDNRDQPMYVLYDDFRDKISYTAFKEVYKHNTYTNLKTNVEPYPYNFEFSCQFNNHSPLEYDDLLSIRESYAKGIDWEIIYEEYKEDYPYGWDFWNIYNGNRFSLVCPEVFTEENRLKHSRIAANKRKGENNGRAKLTEEDVKAIRQMSKSGISNSDIYKAYSQVSKVSIRNVINYKTWKNVL